MSLATAYALGDVLALKHSLHRKAWDAEESYLVYCGLIAAAAILVLIPGAPLGLITEGGANPRRCAAAVGHRVPAAVQ